MSNVIQSFVYVLHFNTNLSHARHYIGSTENLKKRLETHAAGYGSRLTRELHEQGISWRLGALGTTSHNGVRKIERKLKNQHNSERYCEICSQCPKLIPGTKPYPLDAIPFPIESVLMKGYSNDCISIYICEDEFLPSIGRINREQTINGVKCLMSKERDKLGFIPAKGDDGIGQLYDSKKLCVAVADGCEVIGYVGFTMNREKTQLNIMQACVHDGFRLRGIAKKMLWSIEQFYKVPLFTAKVRDDLAANEFWTACGYAKVGDYIHDTSASTMNVYHKEIADAVR